MPFDTYSAIIETSFTIPVVGSAGRQRILEEKIGILEAYGISHRAFIAEFKAFPVMAESLMVNFRSMLSATSCVKQLFTVANYLLLHVSLRLLQLNGDALKSTRQLINIGKRKRDILGATPYALAEIDANARNPSQRAGSAVLGEFMMQMLWSHLLLTLLTLLALLPILPLVPLVLLGLPLPAALPASTDQVATER
ncbi:hypothetical protein B484DRAFT_399147 [Ochromonadaceae sp. CCMP2298]|nr:hypothetical protein B484DRAFT_399147 [Ochromonadaceae sp. CCMP2298]